VVEPILYGNGIWLYKDWNMDLRGMIPGSVVEVSSRNMETRMKSMVVSMHRLELLSHISGITIMAYNE